MFDKLLEKKYKNIVVLVLDGMGKCILDNNLSKDGFFNSHLVGTYSSVFPPTTVAAITSIDSGKYPNESCYLGWDCYYEEIDKTVSVFTNCEACTNIQAEEYNVASTLRPYESIIDKINKMSSELASVETLKTDFISNVSHELKTPLTIIGNYGTLLQSEDLDDEQRLEYARAITSTTHRLADLITNVLRLNKLENQQIYPDMKKYNLSEQLCECLLQFENIWEEKNIDMKTNIEDDVFIYADNELLSLVWNNLISNALKFTDENGLVSVELKIEEEYVVITIKDTGCGMSAETGKHIFDRFYQGDTSHATQGNGLGLALVKRVIDVVNGEIFVQSELGIGSKFEIRLKNEYI